jgi:hypothetical protein
MDRHVPGGLLVARLVAMFLLSGCAGFASPSAMPAATAGATPVGTGHVIHVNIAVPLASAATLGSACDATALRATGPKAATIPGSRVQLGDFDRMSEAFDRPDQSTGTIDTIAPLGEQIVPQTGIVVKAISDDPGFPAACVFSMDVPTTTDPNKAYVFTVGSIYFPVPLMLRSDLETAGWVANIGVNPQ